MDREEPARSFVSKYTNRGCIDVAKGPSYEQRKLEEPGNKRDCIEEVGEAAEDKKGVFCNIGMCGKLLWGCEICQVANTTHGKRTRR